MFSKLYKKKENKKPKVIELNGFLALNVAVVIEIKGYDTYGRNLK